MAFMFISAIVSYIISVISEVVYCFDMEAHADSEKSDKALVCFVSTFIVATTILALAVVLRIFHIL